MTEGRADLNAGRDERAAAVYGAIVRVAATAAVFSVIVIGLMLANHFQLRAADPRNSPELKALKVELRKHPRDEKIKARIRDLDLRLRADFVRRIDFSHKGSYLLLIGIGAFLIAAPAAAAHRRKVFLPETEAEGTDEVRRDAVFGRRAVAAFGIIMAAGFGFLVAASRGDLTASYARAVRDYEKNPPPDFRTPAGQPASNPLAGIPASMLVNLQGRPSAAPAPPGAAPPAPTAAPPASLPPFPPTILPPAPLPGPTGLPERAPAKPKPELAPEAAFDKSDYGPSAEAFARNWPVFRGPAGGLVPDDSYPTSWDGPTGEGVLWKTEIPLPGWNSAVVWEDRVYLAGADEKRREIYCVDAKSGKLLWTRAVDPMLGGGPPDVSEDTGYAAPTVAVDGRRVFAIFPNGDVVCYSVEGRRLWGRSLGSPDNMYGYASSLATFRSLLIVQYDQGSGDDGKSALIALQGATGKVVWRARRPVANSWSSPMVVRSGDRGVVVTCANPWTMAHDALSGKELWRAKLLTGDVAPSPAYADGTAYVCNSGSVLAAVRADGRGDVTASHVPWQATEGLPDITSPTANGELLFLVTSDGMLTCYDARSGRKVWDHYLETPVRASPIIADGRVFILDGEGVMHIIAADTSFKEERRSAIGEKANATPAFVDGRIYIRGVKHLFCVGTK